MRKGVFKSISAGWEIRTAPVCKYQVIGRKKLQLPIIVQTQEAMPNPAKPFLIAVIIYYKIVQIIQSLK